MKYDCGIGSGLLKNALKESFPSDIFVSDFPNLVMYGHSSHFVNR